MKAKRQFMAIMLVASTFAATAQNSNQSSLQIKEEGKTEFVPHWFMQVQAGAAHTRGEAKFGDLISPAAAIYGGYQFTPLWGLRAGISGWQAKGGWTAYNQLYKYNYLQGNVDATLDLSNLFCRYNPDRFFNAYLFAGIGLNGAFNNDEAVALANKGYELRYLWKDNKISPVGRFGLGTNLRLTSHLFFNIEVNANVLSDKFNSKKAGNADWYFNALASVTIRLGKTYKKKAAPAPEPVEQTIVEPVVEEKPVSEPVVEEVKDEGMKRDVFFTINSSVIRESEREKVVELSKYLNNHKNAIVEITGYADAGTGTAAINSRLSSERAEAVKKMLTEQCGVSASQIKTSYKGSEVQPFADNDMNRVSICIISN